MPDFLHWGTCPYNEGVGHKLPKYCLSDRTAKNLHKTLKALFPFLEYYAAWIRNHPHLSGIYLKSAWTTKHKKNLFVKKKYLFPPGHWILNGEQKWFCDSETYQSTSKVFIYSYEQFFEVECIIWQKSSVVSLESALKQTDKNTTYVNSSTFMLLTQHVYLQLSISLNLVSLHYSIRIISEIDRTISA